ncbi:MAG: tetratricopeptide repeat protein [Bryobacteraceae bacterium]
MIPAKKLALLLPLIAAGNLGAAVHWIVLKTPHFEMYTTNGAKQGTKALKVFEQVRYFFMQENPSKTAPATPVRIIAFRNETQYKPYRFNEGAFAYYQRGRKCDYIVMQDISSEHYRAAIHEYTHLIVEHLGLHLPIWQNEGLADFYSSLESKGNKAEVGAPLPGRVMILRTQPWLPLSVLLNVGRDSPYYNERNKMSIFYAESWALTHMLEMSKQYGSNFPAFLSCETGGRPSADCFSSVYGKTLKQVTASLHAYMHQAGIYVALFPVTLPEQSLHPEVAPLSDLQRDLTLADLLATQPRTATEAEQRLTTLSKQHPQNADVEESLGYLAWQQGKLAAARAYFGKAEKNGSQDPDMLFQYAGLLREARASDNEIMDTLQKAIALRPGFFDAQFNLGMAAMHASKWGRALGYFTEIKSVKADRAFSLFYAMAICDYNLRGLEASRTEATRAQKYAKTSQEKSRAAGLLAFLERAQQHPAQAQPQPLPSNIRQTARNRQPAQWFSGLQHVEGMVTYVECHGKSLRLRVRIGAKLMLFEIDDPKSVQVRNMKNGHFEVTCGPQKPFRVGVGYISGPKSGPVAGVVRELVF